MCCSWIDTGQCLEEGSCSEAGFAGSTNFDLLSVSADQVMSSSGEPETVPGYNTYRIVLSLGSEVSNVYAMFGDSGRPMSFPPAYQTDPPFGTDVGMPSQAFFQFAPDAQYDSWLTIQNLDDVRGATEFSGDDAIKDIGIDFTEWSQHRLRTDDGSVFVLPTVAPSGSGASRSVLISQLTIRNDALDRVARINLQGQRAGHVDGIETDWEIPCIEVHLGNAPPQTPAPAQETTLCPVPVIEDGSVEGSNLEDARQSYPVGFNLTVRCSRGFTLRPSSPVGDPAVMQCLGNGQFSPSFQCVRAPSACTNIPPHAEMQPSLPASANAVISVTCVQGYAIRPPQTTQVT
eukprot:SAG31_NODE_8170_length_1504_cov_1.723843_1_plen_345_part_01